jgi:hypothetical protein
MLNVILHLIIDLTCDHGKVLHNLSGVNHPAQLKPLRLLRVYRCGMPFCSKFVDYCHMSVGILHSAERLALRHKYTRTNTIHTSPACANSLVYKDANASLNCFVEKLDLWSRSLVHSGCA